MNLELREQLEKLNDAIHVFIEYVEDHVTEETDEAEEEYKFLEDESGVSNTHLDNLMESLYHITDAMDRIK
jgi:hypothetical protein